MWFESSRRVDHDLIHIFNDVMVANYNTLNEKESMSLRESQTKREEKYKEEGQKEKEEEGKDKKGSQG